MKELIWNLKMMCTILWLKKRIEYKLGARGLRSICESILNDAMYELPSQKVKTFDVTLEYAKRKFKISKLSMLKVA